MDEAIRQERPLHGRLYSKKTLQDISQDGPSSAFTYTMANDLRGLWN